MKNAAWRMLNAALGDLVIETGAAGAAVLDDGNGLWCTSHPGLDARADRFYREEIATHPEVKLRRGVGFHLVRTTPPDHAYIAESFSSIYVLVLFFDADFDPFTNRTLLKSALPRVERLTLAIPPPNRSDA